MSAFVSLIGGGLGDVSLLTLGGRAALEKAEVVLFDALANPELLQFCLQAQTIYVGKKGYGQQTRQEDIHALLVEAAQQGGGRRVARLKGGDPFVFGRGGEEALALAQAGIPFEIIPGVSSAIAAAAYAGIPVTHRGLARHFAVVTGHDLGGAHLPGHLAHADTLVILMGLHDIAEIAASLLRSGRAAQTPVAAVQRASYPDQRVVSTTLGQMVEDVQRSGLQSPTVLIVGEVTALHEELAWFVAPQSPLAGKKVVVTRTREVGSPLARLLRERGAQVTELPLLHFSRTGRVKELLAAARKHTGWAAFSSEYAVKAFFQELHEAGLDARAIAGLRFAAVGTGTHTTLAKHQIRSDYTPERSGAKYLGEGLPAEPGELVLHFGSQEPDLTLQAALTQRGANYLLLETYRSTFAPLTEAQAQALADADAVTLSSSVAAQSLAAVAGTDFPVFSIGPQTTRAARAAGFERITEAARADLGGMVESLMSTG